MAIFHMVTNIKGLMRNCTDKQLGNLFDMNGKQARKELQELLDKGDIYIASDGCKHFDGKIGCLCRNYDENGNLLNLNPTEK
jgi:uncharacterized cysteine cluster protein YcgN (CxxCxxCC family)